MIAKLLKWIIGSDFINWIAPSFQGGNNTSSSRRVSAFFIMFLFGAGHAIYFYKVMQDCASDSNEVTLKALDQLLYLLITDTVFVLMLFGIVTAQHIVSISKSKAIDVEKIKKGVDAPSQPEVNLNEGPGGL